MNLEKVVFSFFMILALTLNFGFFYGEADNPEHHNVYELFAVLVVNLVATVLKFGDRSQMGAMLLALLLAFDLIHRFMRGRLVFVVGGLSIIIFLLVWAQLAVGLID